MTEPKVNHEDGSNRSRSSTIQSNRSRSESVLELYSAPPNLILSPIITSTNSISSTTTGNNNSDFNSLLDNSSGFSMKTVLKRDSFESNSSVTSSIEGDDTTLSTTTAATPTSSKRNSILFNLIPASPRHSISSRRNSLTHSSHHTQSNLTNSPTNTLKPISPYLSSLPSHSTSSTILHLGGEDELTFAERRPGLYASLKALVVFLISFVFIYFLLRSLLPPIALEDKPLVKIPRSFEDLKALNTVLQVYKVKYYWRVLSSFIIVYLFVQTFSIPGSMYLSILAGAMYGIVMAVPLVCFCVATGALLCYLLSSVFLPALLQNSTKWQHRVDVWKAKVAGHDDNLISYLIILRISPLPPHWIVNLLSPHLGIPIPTFWISTFFGIGAVTFIHAQIGTTLDQMSSSSDFNLLSWQNILGLGGVILAVLIPVLLRSRFKKDIEVDEEEATEEDFEVINNEDSDEEDEVSRGSSFDAVDGAADVWRSGREEEEGLVAHSRS